MSMGCLRQRLFNVWDFLNDRRGGRSINNGLNRAARSRPTREKRGLVEMAQGVFQGAQFLIDLILKTSQFCPECF